MGETADVFDDVMTPAIAEKGDDYFIDVTVQCTEIHDPWEVDYIRAPQKISQCGMFEDGEGQQIRFKAWDGSNPHEYEVGEMYDFTDLQLVYGKNAESYAFVVRSKTESKPSENGFSAGVGDQVCTQCGSEITDENRHSGPEAPEIGWEYYECPDCGHRMRPESV